MQACMFNSNISSSWNGCPSGKPPRMFSSVEAYFLCFSLFCAKQIFTNMLRCPAGEVECPALPGRPLICVNPNTPCQSACQRGYKVCGLQRVNGQLVIGADGRPLPNCVLDANATLCDQPSIRPLPSNFTGGNGLASWNPIRLDGTDSAGSKVGSIAEIGCDAVSDTPAFFAGNGSDASVVVKVRITVVE